MVGFSLYCPFLTFSYATAVTCTRCLTVQHKEHQTGSHGNLLRERFTKHSPALPQRPAAVSSPNIQQPDLFGIRRGQRGSNWGFETVRGIPLTGPVGESHHRPLSVLPVSTCLRLTRKHLEASELTCCVTVHLDKMISGKVS